MVLSKPKGEVLSKCSIGETKGKKAQNVSIGGGKSWKEIARRGTFACRRRWGDSARIALTLIKKEEKSKGTVRGSAEVFC